MSVATCPRDQAELDRLEARIAELRDLAASQDRATYPWHGVDADANRAAARRLDRRASTMRGPGP